MNTSYQIVFEGKIGGQIHRGQRDYRSAAQAVKAAEKQAALGYQCSAFQVVNGSPFWLFSTQPEAMKCPQATN